MAFGIAKRSPLHKSNRYVPKLIESYCPGCGLLIAASPSKKILAIMERLHVCPVYFRYSHSRRIA